MEHSNLGIYIKVNNRIMPELVEGIIPIPFNSEYSIYLENNDYRRAIINIEVDGRKVFKNGDLILDGNDSIEIKGFMMDLFNTSKFKFVKRCNNIRKLRTDSISDGYINISFKHEIKKHRRNSYISTLPYNDEWWNTHDGKRRAVSTDSTLYHGKFNCMCNSYNYDENIGITINGNNIKQRYVNGSVGDLEDKGTVVLLKLIGDDVKTRSHPTHNYKTCNNCNFKNELKNKYCYNCGQYLR